MLSVFDVFFVHECVTRYIIVSDEYIVSSAIDYVRNDINLEELIEQCDGDTMFSIETCFQEKIPVRDCKTHDLYVDCLMRHAMKHYEHSKTRLSVHVSWLPAGYIADEDVKYHIKEFNGLFETNGRSVIVQRYEDAYNSLMEYKVWITENLEKRLVGMYAEGHDITFIMEETYSGEEPVSMECVGWYHGGPDDESNKRLVNELKATYDFV